MHLQKHHDTQTKKKKNELEAELKRNDQFTERSLTHLDGIHFALDLNRSIQAIENVDNLLDFSLDNNIAVILLVFLFITKTKIKETWNSI